MSSQDPLLHSTFSTTLLVHLFEALSIHNHFLEHKNISQKHLKMFFTEVKYAPRYLFSVASPKVDCPYLEDGQKFKEYVSQIIGKQTEQGEVGEVEGTNILRGWCGIDSRGDVERAYGTQIQPGTRSKDSRILHSPLRSDARRSRGTHLQVTRGQVRLGQEQLHVSPSRKVWSGHRCHPSL
jgi:hypothetical protein